MSTTLKQPEREPDRVFYGKIKFWLEDGIGLYNLQANEMEEITFAMKQNDMFLTLEAEHAIFLAILKTL